MFLCFLNTINENPSIESIDFITPTIDRDSLSSENLPKSILNKNEKKIFSHITEDYLNEDDRKNLVLRD
jgi:hypothetical protein